jgi:rhamnose utilization protein RhaD (predicted bifunctional aldolase and dehydrogenase)
MGHRRLAEFISMCRSLSDPQLAQGFGGNLSTKFSNGTMAIKASGARLSDVRKGKAYSLLKYCKVARLYSKAPYGSERQALCAIASSVLPEDGARPSMEAGFHSFLGTHVAHLHPACFNALACQEGAREILSKIYGKGNFVWVKYARPGHRLACAVRRAVGRRKECVIFLQNHGLIVSSGNAKECICKAIKIERKAEKYLKASGAPAFLVTRLAKGKQGYWNSSPAAVEFAARCANAWRFASPDAAVFFSRSFSGRCAFAGGSQGGRARPKWKIRAVAGKGLEFLLPWKEASAANETFCAHAFVLAAASGTGGKIACLPRAEILGLCGMESEKYRQKAAGV